MGDDQINNLIVLSQGPVNSLNDIDECSSRFYYHVQLGTPRSDGLDRRANKVVSAMNKIARKCEDITIKSGFQFRRQAIKLFFDVLVRICWCWLAHPFSFLLFHLAFAAILAISRRRLFGWLRALAGPPMRPPSFPRATAAGFFCLGSVASCTIAAARAFGSDGFLERLGIPHDSMEASCGEPR